MNINRNNYEEFFLMYVDNELDAPSKKAVDIFVAENPDLAIELSMLKDTILSNEKITAPNKNILLKAKETFAINDHNYEEYFLLYVDKELDDATCKEVELFTVKQKKQIELSLLQEAKLEADDAIIYPWKAELIRNTKERSTPVLGFYFKIAVAAVVVLAIGLLWLRTNESSPNLIVQNKLYKEEEKNRSAGSTQLYVQQPKPESASEKPLISIKEKSNNIKLVKKFQENNIKEPTVQIDEKELPEFSHSVVRKFNTQLASSDESLVNVIDLTDRPAIVVEPDNNIQKTSYGQNEQDDVKMAGLDPKNKVRGFLRKVTRYVSMASRLPGSEAKSLLSGNTEVALK